MGMQNEKRKIKIVKESNGKNLVIVEDIRFKGRRGINWKEVERYLKEYIGSCYEILETSEKIYIGRDFPGEFCYSKDTSLLMGTNAKAKANAALAIGELIQTATNKVSSEDYNKRHGNRARWGWYRYDARFALPVYSDEGFVERYNIFSVRLLIRHAQDGAMYLYDVLRTKKESNKKETSKPPRQ